ncbi:Uncharacterised protein [Citrobacter koseri]|nr:hypothetical protein [Citrobacter koseri]SQB09528.1 Uncharacterised protein [Citrobacter koseri]STB26806.1 Uncharacterised protein [Citrobacter koseri]
MSNKILNPVVLIHKRENSDTYTVAITSGSQDYHDAVLMATMEQDMTGDDVDTWSKTGYYMAAEIETLRRICSEAYQCVGVLADRCGALDDTGFIKLLDNLSQMKLVHDDLLPFQLSFCEKSGLTHAADTRQSGSNPATVPVNGVTDGKPLAAGTSVSFTIDELSAMFSWMIPPHVVANTHTDEFNELRNKVFYALCDARHRENG